MKKKNSLKNKFPIDENRTIVNRMPGARLTRTGHVLREDVADYFGTCPRGTRSKVNGRFRN